MTLTFLSDSLKIADLVALKAIAFSERRDGMVKIVDAIASVSPIYNLKDITYRYDASSSLDAAEPAIVLPDDSNGRWIMERPRIIMGTLVPSSPPPLADLTWVAFLDTPSRKVIWHSPVNLSDTPTIDDWQPNYDPIDLDGIPTFSAEFVGQKVRDTNTGYIYRAINNTGDWVLSKIDNNFVPGTDILGDETVGLSYHSTRKKLTSNAIVTLPASLINIEFQLISFGTTLTLRPDTGTTLNNGTADIVITDAIASVFNLGDDWVYG